MGMIIKRKTDNRVVKCVLHRVADIPGGLTIKVADLGGNSLFEGTPIGIDSDGVGRVVKTAQIITEADTSATSFDVAKGHHFKVGDRFATASCNGQTITTIDKSNAAKDVITVGTALSTTAKVAAGTCAFESGGANKVLKYSPIAIAGSNEDVVDGDNLFVSAWVIGVVKEANAPIVDDAIKTALKGVQYV